MRLSDFEAQSIIKGMSEMERIEITHDVGVERYYIKYSTVEKPYDRESIHSERGEPFDRVLLRVFGTASRHNPLP